MVALLGSIVADATPTVEATMARALKDTANQSPLCGVVPSSFFVCRKIIVDAG
jgi:hypothetical protein